MNTLASLALRSRGILALLAGISLLLSAARVHAQDDATPLAPPVDAPSAPAGSNVFNWADVPQNQTVPITRAVFDQGGYQLYDQAGETIVVPFQGNNLYVMKFAASQTGDTYFVNDSGQTPVLYLPQHGYLENATANGARWYPFNQQFYPTDPVFLGIAPSYAAYVAMGWYPDEVYSGGYYSSEAYVAGALFAATLGLTFVLGGHSYHDWNDYTVYVTNYPAPYQMGWYHRDYYSLAGRPDRTRMGRFSGYNGYNGGPMHGGPGGSRPGFGGHAGPGGLGSHSGFGGGPAHGGIGAGATAHSGFGGVAPHAGPGGSTVAHAGPGGSTTSHSGFGGSTMAHAGPGGSTASHSGFGGASAATHPSFGGSGATTHPSFVGGSAGGTGFGGASASHFGGGTSSHSAYGGGTGGFGSGGSASGFGSGGFGGSASHFGSSGGSASHPSYGGTGSSGFSGTGASHPSYGGGSTSHYGSNGSSSSSKTSTGSKSSPSSTSGSAPH